MSRGPESKLTAKILKALREGGGHWVKVPGTGMTKRGISDILGCYLGWFTAIEVKDPQGGHPLSFPQAVFLWKVYQAGGNAGVAYSVEDALEIPRTTWPSVSTLYEFPRYILELPISQKEVDNLLEAWNALQED